MYIKIKWSTNVHAISSTHVRDPLTVDLRPCGPVYISMFATHQDICYLYNEYKSMGHVMISSGSRHLGKCIITCTRVYVIAYQYSISYIKQWCVYLYIYIHTYIKWPTNVHAISSTHVRDPLTVDLRPCGPAYPCSRHTKVYI